MMDISVNIFIGRIQQAFLIVEGDVCTHINENACQNVGSQGNVDLKILHKFLLRKKKDIDSNKCNM